MPGDFTPPALTPAEAYRLWAPCYDPESAFSAIEEQGVRARTAAPTRETRLLDAGCGTARRLAACDGAAGSHVGIDLVPEMLLEGRHRHGPGLSLAAADLRALPFGHSRFDLVWCRLALGHLHDLYPAYAELARVSRPGATIVITDFHPHAVDSGFARSFRDSAGGLHAVQHFRHDALAHQRAALDAGLTFVGMDNLKVGPVARPYYQAAGRGDAYEQQRGSPMVLLLWYLR